MMNSLLITENGTRYLKQPLGSSLYRQICLLNITFFSIAKFDPIQLQKNKIKVFKIMPIIYLQF
jgi:hypothetical protein